MINSNKYPEVRFSNHAPGEQPLSDARPLLLPLPDHQQRLALREQPDQVAAEQPLGQAVQGTTAAANNPIIPFCYFQTSGATWNAPILAYGFALAYCAECGRDFIRCLLLQGTRMSVLQCSAYVRERSTSR